mmetsp:Transcript_16781/g.41313  ORF Transcript_16781/g.41313 Transcript_16781/m.41313 type:complete len:371 (-) Transcript_16781:145-1257(-)
MCSFGSTCRWHHPEGVEGKLSEAKQNSVGLPIRPEAEVCDYYRRTGECKFGITCKFTHPEKQDANDQLPGESGEVDEKGEGGEAQQQKNAQAAQGKPAKLNEKGFPSRPGEQVCSYYMKFGDCKFGPECCFDHPFNVEPNPNAGYDASENLNSKGLPIRFGCQVCDFYMRTGVCKFGATCKYHHPENIGNGMGAMGNSNGGRGGMGRGGGMANRGGMAGRGGMMGRGRGGMGNPNPMLNSYGYPLRPGVPPCSFYQRTGTCSFGATCKWNHPEGDQMGMQSGQGMQQGGMQQDQKFYEQQYDQQYEVQQYEPQQYELQTSYGGDFDDGYDPSNALGMEGGSINQGISFPQETDITGGMTGDSTWGNRYGS